MLVTLAHRLTVKTLDAVVGRGKASARAPVRAAAGALDRLRGFVGLDAVRRDVPLPKWDGQRAQRPMWDSDRHKLHKHQVDAGIVKPDEDDADERADRDLTPVIEVYFKRGCPYTRAAKGLLQEREIPFVEHDVTEDAQRRTWLQTVTRSKTTPQLFLFGEPIGGYSELQVLDTSGELARRIEHGPQTEGDAPKRRLPVIHPEHSPFEGLTDDYAGPVETLEGDALVERVREILDECRPMVQADGGDIVLLDVQPDTVRVELTGNCVGCPSSQATLRQGIERRLRARLPQIAQLRSPQLGD